MPARMEKAVRQVPPSRIVLPGFNQPFSFEWNFVPPKGKQLTRLFIDAKLTTTGAGMTTAVTSAIFDKIQAFNVETGQIMDIDKFALDMACITLAGFNRRDEYADEIPRTTNVVRDPPNVATGATLYGSWNLRAPLPGKAIKLIITTFNLQIVFGAGMTAGTLSLQVVPIWGLVDVEPAKEYTIFARQFTSIPKVVVSGAEYIAMTAASEISSIAGNLDIGGPMTTEEVLRLEAMTNDELRGFAADGSSTATDTLPVKDPVTTTDVFVLYKKFDQAQRANLIFNSAATVRVIVLGQKAVTEVAVTG